MICRRFSDLAVWSVLFIHPTLGAYSRNSTSLSFLALERSTDGGPPGMSKAMSSNQVPVNRQSHGKRTAVEANAERLQCAGTH